MMKKVNKNVFLKKTCFITATPIFLQDVCKYEASKKRMIIYIRGLKLKLVGGPHSREKNALRAAVYKKKAFAGHKIQEKPSK
jgi:hypothetical protein